ncbi:MAG: hypothetical protein IJZ16_01465 [Clostridia bacterium]|nr:hypothetical protein [Clostridia bacterium]
MKNKRINKLCRAIMAILGVLIVFFSTDYILSEITDIWAYKDATGDDAKWNEIIEKFNNNQPLSTEDYDEIFLQSGLGKPAIDKLISENDVEKIQEYRDYYLLDKDYYCFRKGIFACHERITDTSGEEIRHPDFADLQNGDIIVTLSIHSLGWRHGHSTIITDAENGVGVQAVMVGEKSNNTQVYSWKKYPLVAVLRPKDTSTEVRNQAALYAEENLKGLYYSLFGGIFSGRDAEKPLKTTQCAHLVWYSYMVNGIDIAPESGRIITPKDFLKSENLEVVQIYGNITDLI